VARASPTAGDGTLFAVSAGASPGVPTPDGLVFDADNHYYEATDAFTRHLDPSLGRRIIEWCEIGGRRYHVIAGHVNHAVVNPTFDPIARAGAMSEYFRGNASGRSPVEYLSEREPIRPEYRDRDARLRVMDEQGVDKVWLFPTLGVLYETPMAHDPEGVGIMFDAFNRWLDEDWGFAYRGRIFAAPYLSLADLDAAIRQLEWVLDRGARVIVMRPAAPTTALGQRPPASEWFDGFWARVNEAGITVVAHAGDSGYSRNGYGYGAFTTGFGSGRPRGAGASASRRVPRGGPATALIQFERAIYDFLASLVFDDLFGRYPNIRVASVENGAQFLPDLFRKLRSARDKAPMLFAEDPVETFRRSIWINPFWEDDANEVVECMGADRVVFGSDWPHIEGMQQPLEYLPELKDLDDDERRLILRDNAEHLNTPQPL
jgi:predicted TIM-barrel fold metal-dependent hydrolase